MSEQSPSMSSPLDEPALSRPVRWLLKLVAGVSLVLGLIGIFVPIMPTVPFILLAAWAATKSSPRLARWLENHPRMGPPIREWRHGGVVRRSAKWYATVMMSAGGLALLVLARPIWVPVSAITLMTAVGIWLWLRPEHLPGTDSTR